MNIQHTSGAEPQQRVRPETLATIAVNNGQETACLRRELDPSGAIVVHAVKRSGYVHQRLHDLGRIDDEMFDAAERFRKDFERAGLEGHFATVDLNRSRAAGMGEMSDAVVEARQRVQGAMSALGQRKNGKSLSKSCVWYVVGCGNTFEQWSVRCRNNGENMSDLKASGILVSALERLAFHYGMTSTADLKERAAKHAYERGRRETSEAALVLVDMCAQNNDPKKAFDELKRLLKEKFGRYKNGG